MVPGHLPASAAWRHRDARDGFEVVFLRTGPDAHHLEGSCVGVEDGQTWAVRYFITVDQHWTTRTAHVIARSTAGLREVRLETDGGGSWRVDSAPAPHLDGCRDVDLEASVVTNALPVHRLRLGIGQEAQAPAAFVRAVDATVERLEQRYVRIGDEDGHQRYDYSAPRFDYAGRLAYDGSGLLLAYPGLAERVL